jgi:hypothetical protein
MWVELGILFYQITVIDYTLTLTGGILLGLIYGTYKSLKCCYKVNKKICQAIRIKLCP